MMKKRYVLLGAFDLVIAFGAIFTGLLMLSKQGVFLEYPPEWINILPFKNWFIPGLMCILIFGFGNIAAAILSLIGKGSRAWLLSFVAGGALLICDITQIILLKQWFLISLEVLPISLLQLFLSCYALLNRKVV